MEFPILVELSRDIFFRIMAKTGIFCTCTTNHYLPSTWLLALFECFGKRSIWTKMVTEKCHGDFTIKAYLKDDVMNRCIHFALMIFVHQSLNQYIERCIVTPLLDSFSDYLALFLIMQVITLEQMMLLRTTCSRDLTLRQRAQTLEPIPRRASLEDYVSSHNSVNLTLRSPCLIPPKV